MSSSWIQYQGTHVILGADKVYALLLYVTTLKILALQKITITAQLGVRVCSAQTRQLGRALIVSDGGQMAVTSKDEGKYTISTITSRDGHHPIIITNVKLLANFKSLDLGSTVIRLELTVRLEKKPASTTFGLEIYFYVTNGIKMTKVKGESMVKRSHYRNEYGTSRNVWYEKVIL